MAKKKIYLDNDKLTAEMIKCKESKVASEELGKMFMLIVDNVSKSFYWANPDDGEDCKANALMDMCRNFWKFDPEHGQAFSFCTSMAYFGIGGAWRVLHPKKYDGTVSITTIDSNGNSFDFYNL